MRSSSLGDYLDKDAESSNDSSSSTSSSSSSISSSSSGDDLDKAAESTEYKNDLPGVVNATHINRATSHDDTEKDLPVSKHAKVACKSTQAKQKVRLPGNISELELFPRFK